MTLAWQAFREQLLERLERANPQPVGDALADRYWRLTPDHWIHVCPACRSALPEYLAIRFHGELAAADYHCSRGCTDTLIRAALERLRPRHPHDTFIARWGRPEEAA